MRQIIAFFTLWAALIVQSTIFQVPPVNVVQPNFILVALIVLALAQGARTALVLGIMIGLVQDAVFGSFLGLNAFTYGVLGYFAASAFSQFLHKNITITFLVTLAATFIQQWFTFGLTRMFDVTAHSWRMVTADSLWQMMQNGVLLLLLYPVFIRLFGLKTKSGYLAEDSESQ